MLLKPATFVLILSFCVIANAGTNGRFNLRTDNSSEFPSEGWSWSLVLTKVVNIFMDFVLKRNSSGNNGQERQIMKLKASTYATGMSPEELKEMAESLEAPFTNSSNQRLDGKSWNDDRAGRSTNCVIINRSDKNFTLVENGCGSGRWTYDLRPNNSLPAHASVVYGTESKGFMPGATDCKVLYRCPDGATIELSVSNPYTGRNHASSKGSGISAAQPVVTSGNNNQVRFDIGLLSLQKQVPFIEVYSPKDEKLAPGQASP